MFYLINFYRILLNTPFKSLVFIFMALSIVSGLTHSKKLDKLVFQEIPDESDYFYALISNKKNTNDISRKIQNLPGIKFVQNIPSKTIKQELVKILKHSDLNEYIESSLENLDYNGLKIIFSSNIKVQSQNLIRDYLFRLVGKKNLTLGPVQKKPATVLQKQKPFMFFKKYIVLLSIGFGITIWLLLGISYMSAFHDNSYVIENFQRRKSVSFKTVLWGMISLFTMGLLIALVIGRVDSNGVLMAILPFLIVILWHTKAREWQY